MNMKDLENQKAPAISLPDASGKIIKLSDFSGSWVVVYFYPKDDTPGCTREAISFSCARDEFASEGAVVLGISADSVESHVDFAEKFDLKLALLSDPSKEVIAAYGAWGIKKLYGKESLGLIRSTFLIDPAGIVKKVWAAVKVDGHAERVLAVLRELKKGN